MQLKPTIPLKSRNANETEKRLLDSALNLFSEKGFEGASIREIIERAGVTRPVLYYYFENKEALFRRLVESWFSELVADIDSALLEVVGCRERLLALMRQAFIHVERSPAVVRLVLQVFFSPASASPYVDKDRLWESRFSRIVEIMREGCQSGELSCRRSPDTLAMVYCGIIDRYTMAKCHNPNVDLSVDRAAKLVDLFLDGATAGAPAAARVDGASPFE